MPRKALPIHVDTMPSIQVNGLVVRMQDVAARINVGIASHATPRHTTRFRISRDNPLISRSADTSWIRSGDHNGRSTCPHELLADMRLASATAAERLIPVNH